MQELYLLLEQTARMLIAQDAIKHCSLSGVVDGKAWSWKATHIEYGIWDYTLTGVEFPEVDEECADIF